MDPCRRRSRPPQPANPQTDLGSRRQGRVERPVRGGLCGNGALPRPWRGEAPPPHRQIETLRRLRPHPVLRAQVRHHQPYVFEADVRWYRFFNVSEPLDSLFHASRLNQRLRVGRNPLRIQLHLPTLDQIRHRANDSRNLPRPNPTNLLEAATLIQKPKRLFRRSRLPGHGRRRARSIAKVPKSLENFRTVHICLLFANSWHLLQLGKIRRTPAAQLLQRAVVQNNVRGHLVLSRRISPPLAQILRQRWIRFRPRRISYPRFFGMQLRGIEGRRRRGRKKCLSRRRVGQGNSHHLFAQPLWLRSAIVAVPAALPFRSLSEMQADLPVTAARRIREAADHAFPLERPFALRVIRNLIDEILQQNVVPLLPEQHAIRGTPVPPGAASFLVVLLNGLRQRQVNHRPYRGLVDAQAKRDCPDQYPHFVRHPSFLILLPYGRFHLRVIGNRSNSALLQI